MASISVLSGLMACSASPAQNAPAAQAAPVEEHPEPVTDLRTCLKRHYFKVGEEGRLEVQVPQGSFWKSGPQAVEIYLSWRLNDRATRAALKGTEALPEGFAPALFADMGHEVAANADERTLTQVKTAWKAACPVHSDLLFYSSTWLIEAGLGKDGPALCIPHSQACGMVMP